MRLAKAPHRWNLSPREAIRVQRDLAAKLDFSPPRTPIRTVAGLDAAFSRDGGDCIGGVVLWDVEQRVVLESHSARRALRFPYVPGLLSFREAPALLAALAKLTQRPDAILCDGQGYAHPRRLGIACHIGIVADLPSAGCAKSRLVGEHREPAARRGSRARLTDRGEVIGCVLRTRDGVKPVYVSTGHHMNLATAEKLVLRCAIGYRLPEPTRLADRLVAEVKRTG
jgi:deoxyribonuclease V